jgi:hypothetical protein
MRDNEVYSIALAAAAFDEPFSLKERLYEAACRIARRVYRGDDTARVARAFARRTPSFGGGRQARADREYRGARVTFRPGGSPEGAEESDSDFRRCDRRGIDPRRADR